MPQPFISKALKRIWTIFNVKWNDDPPKKFVRNSWIYIVLFRSWNYKIVTEKTHDLLPCENDLIHLNPRIHWLVDLHGDGLGFITQITRKALPNAFFSKMKKIMNSEQWTPVADLANLGLKDRKNKGSCFKDKAIKTILLCIKEIHCRAQIQIAWIYVNHFGQHHQKQRGQRKRRISEEGHRMFDVWR